MCVAAGASVVSTGASIAGSIIGYGSATKQAYQQKLYNAQVTAQNEKYRAELIKYQNVEYQSAVDYGGQVLDYQKSEYDRQAKQIEKATGNIEQNLFNNYAQIMQRQVEEAVASAFDTETVERQSRKMRAGAQAAADSRGVEGTSIEQIIGDVSRQAGDAVTVLEMNRSASMRQLNLAAMGLKAQADQSLYNIKSQTWEPMAPINAPQPVASVQPSAPVAMPSAGALAANIVNSGVQGMQNYASWSGQSMRDAFKL